MAKVTRLWLSRNSAAGLREQLVTQIRLSILSGDLRAGERLSSVRDIARRYPIHANTVSAAYRDLVSQGWLEFRRGSGVYVQDLRASQSAPVESPLDGMVREFLTATRARGFSSAEVRAQLTRSLGGEPVRRLLVAEPEPELCGILVAELNGQVSIPVTGLDWGERIDPTDVAGAAVTAMLSRADALRGALPPGVAHHFLRLRSLAEHFAGQQRPAPDALIGVASSSPEILRRVRTLLSAAGLDGEALEFRDAREPGWSRGLQGCSFVIADVVTARKLPKKCTARVLHVLPEAAIEELQEFLRLVTDPRVS
jgi:GntR family transcriptional regulator